MVAVGEAERDVLRDRRLVIDEGVDGIVTVGLVDWYGSQHWTLANVRFADAPEAFQQGVLAAVRRLAVS